MLRDVTGGKPAGPDDLVREHEHEILPLIEYQLELGFRWPAVERALRVYGDSLRRAAEGEAEWWRSEVQAPVLDEERPARSLAERAAEISPRLSEASDRAVVAIYHAQQMHVWSTNIVHGIRLALEQAGLHAREEPAPPAMCFLDLTGFTELTQELGDAAAAERVERLNRIVQRISVQHGGRPVKWLGDGVMFHFPEPASGVKAALEMVAALAVAELPRAHVGLHAGPVVRQEGDYYGQTVNLAARIGEYAAGRGSRQPRGGRCVGRCGAVLRRDRRRSAEGHQRARGAVRGTVDPRRSRVVPRSPARSRSAPRGRPGGPDVTSSVSTP